MYDLIPKSIALSSMDSYQLRLGSPRPILSSNLDKNPFADESAVFGFSVGIFVYFYDSSLKTCLRS